MAGIIQIAGYTGAQWYAFIRNSTGQIWNGAAFGVYSSGSWATYVVNLTEQSGSGYYTATFPAGITTAGKYFIAVHETPGGTPAVSDPVVGQATIDWNGSSIEQGVGQVFLTQTLTELGIGIPSATPTIEQCLMLLYMSLRNKQTSDASQLSIFNNAGTAITRAQQSDTGTIYTKEEFGAP